MQFENEIARAVRKILLRRDEVHRFQAAAQGAYDITVGSARFKRQMQTNYHRLADNLVPRVLAAINDRLEVQSIDPYVPNEQLETEIKRTMRKVRFDALTKRAHYAALRDGSSYLVLTKAAGQVGLHLNTADVFEVARDSENPDQIVAGVKIFEDASNKIRLTIYYADRIERYVGNSNLLTMQVGVRRDLKSFNLSSFQLIEEDAVVFHDFGTIPVIPFINQMDHNYEGVSELVSIMPIQLALNAALVNLLAAAEAWSVPTRYIVGLMTDYDDEGNIKTPNPQAGGTWIFGDSEVKIGQLQAADLHQSIAMINDLRSDIARLSGVPVHMLQLTTSYPSGEALRIAESSLVGKIRDRQVVFGNSWEDLISMLVDGDFELMCRWTPAETVSQIESWQAAVLQRNAGVSARQILRERNYTDPQIDMILQERFDEDQQQRELQSMLFNSGADTYNPDLNL